MIDRLDILAAHPIDVWLQKRGHELKKAGPEMLTCCPFHADKNPSLRINPEKGVWFCDPCGFGGTIIDWMIRSDGVTVKEAMQSLAENANLWDREDTTWKPSGTYQYKDQYGRRVMDVDRMEAGAKKKFAQYRVDDDGNRHPGIKGVQRVLYRLEKWAGEESVCIGEGEKVVHALESMGLDATTNPGGSNGWMDSYAEYLRDKQVDIYPDNDDAGEKWCKIVIASLEGKVSRLRVIRMPKIYNDFADMLDAQGEEIAADTLTAIMGKTPYIDRGVILPLLSSREAYELYKRRVNLMDSEGIDLGKWLPSFKTHGRVLLPGDMVAILADTGVGKTAILNNIALSQRPIPIVYFQLELAPEPMAERFVSATNQVTGQSVERSVRQGLDFDVTSWDHIFICPKSKVTLEDMESIIMRAELKIQQKPKLVLIDYIGLMGGGPAKRYERLSMLAEGIKNLARNTETVAIVASQISRDETRTEVGLHDGKDSGSVENSSQLVLGAWRPGVDRMDIRILKQTKRAGQHTIHCLFDGDRQKIAELSNREDELSC